MQNIKAMELASQDAREQAKAAAVLMSIIPALAVFFMSGLMYLPNRVFPPAAQIGTLVFTAMLAFGGYQIVRKYPENIIRLREYIGEIAKGVLPEKIALLDTRSSDDLQYIENSFNAVLADMRRQIAAAEGRLRVEQALRKTIEQQQRSLIEAERHRIMIQTLGTACHHIGQPATVLGVHLEMLKQQADPQTRSQLDNSLKAVRLIGEILNKLRQVSEYKTVPYLTGGPGESSEILDIN